MQDQPKNEQDRPLINVTGPEDLTKKAQLVQQQMKWNNVTLANSRFTGASKDDSVQLTMNGAFKLLEININDAAFSGGKIPLQNAILEASDDATKKIEKFIKSMFEKMLKDIEGK